MNKKPAFMRVFYVQKSFMHKKITEYLNYIYGLERTGRKYDLKKIARLLEETGNPHISQKFIHIAGTNGKGGTASLLASILMEHGLKTGLFTSPHILSFNERIRINSSQITNSYIKDYLSNNIKFIKKIGASFFEVNTGLALKYFYDKRTDAAVIETGLGGRLDATNIIKPQLSIITQLGIEHMDFLGHTLQKIAKEKIGIVKPNVDVIVSDDHSELESLFLKRIENNRLSFIDDKVEVTDVKQNITGSTYTVVFNDYSPRLKVHSPLPGNYQIRNSVTAIFGALKFLSGIGIKADVHKIANGIKNVIANTGYHGRFESLKSGGITYIFDVAHNPDAIKYSLINTENRKIDIIIFALMNDKDYKPALRDLLKYSDTIVFTSPNNKRAQQPKVLFDYAVRVSRLKADKPIRKQYYCTGNVKEALKLSNILVGYKGKILIIGSFFLVSEAIKVLKLKKYFH